MAIRRNVRIMFVALHTFHMRYVSKVFQFNRQCLPSFNQRQIHKHTASFSGMQTQRADAFHICSRDELIERFTRRRNFHRRRKRGKMVYGMVKRLVGIDCECQSTVDHIIAIDSEQRMSVLFCFPLCEFHVLNGNTSQPICELLVGNYPYVTHYHEHTDNTFSTRFRDKILSNKILSCSFMIFENLLKLLRKSFAIKLLFTLASKLMAFETLPTLTI